MNQPAIPDIEIAPWETGNVQPLLHEIRHALKALLNSGKETSIDLRALPMAPGEEKRLLETLGEGEVVVNINALGNSKIYETHFPGVWVTIHLNANDEVLGKFIHITYMPELLISQQQDVLAGLKNLEDELDEK